MWTLNQGDGTISRVDTRSGKLTATIEAGLSGHGGEIAYVFGNFTFAMPATAADRAVSEEMSSYWVNFAKTGDPNGSGLPYWPAFKAADAEVMNLNDSSKATPVPNIEKLQVLDDYYAWRRAQAEKSH